MGQVLRGYARAKDGNLVLIGTMPLPHSKDKPSPREREGKRHLVRRGATIFKRRFIRSPVFKLFSGASRRAVEAADRRRKN
jgi:hypothetical protein